MMPMKSPVRPEIYPQRKQYDARKRLVLQSGLDLRDCWKRDILSAALCLIPWFPKWNCSWHSLRRRRYSRCACCDNRKDCHEDRDTCPALFSKTMTHSALICRTAAYRKHSPQTPAFLRTVRLQMGRHKSHWRQNPFQNSPPRVRYYRFSEDSGSGRRHCGFCSPYYDDIRRILKYSPEKDSATYQFQRLY